MPSLSLAWVIGSGEAALGGKKANPTIEDVLSVLEDVLQSSGSVTLDVIDGPEVGPQSLQVEADGGSSILSLGEDDGEDYNIRTYRNPSTGTQQEQLDVLGNLWDMSLVCQDSDVVRRVFKDFVETGNVSRDLLN